MCIYIGAGDYISLPQHALLAYNPTLLTTLLRCSTCARDAKTGLHTDQLIY